MSARELARLAEIAAQMRDRDLAAFTTARARRKAAEIRVAELIDRCDAEVRHCIGCDEVALKLAELKWQLRAGQSLAALRQEADDLRRVEETARVMALRAQGRFNAVHLLCEREEGEISARRLRRDANEQDGLALSSQKGVTLEAFDASQN